MVDLLRKCALMVCCIATTVSCTNNGIKDPSGVGIAIESGGEFSEKITTDLIFLSIRPNNNAAPLKASSTKVLINSKVVKSYLAELPLGLGKKGDVSVQLAVCYDILPGKNIPIKYEYLAADGSVIESGQVTIAEIEYTCK